MIQIEKYAPVIIPTLNRYEHFKRCLESLERCTGANKTEVYVGLDYPPSEKYVEGWKKIDAYLVEKEKQNGFRNLFVRRRDHNCGIGNPNSNGILLSQEIEQKYDRVISSEDDNEFSPNFLEYMNKALEKYKDEPRVRIICAYSPSEFQGVTSDNIFCSIDVSAYGLGRWYDKDNNSVIKNYSDVDAVLKKGLTRLLKFFYAYPAIVMMAISMIEKRTNWGDVRRSLENMAYGTFAICPSVSLSRNWGCDGSGLHSGIVEEMVNLPISNELHFELDDIKLDLTKQYKKNLRVRNLYHHGIKRHIALLKYFVYVIKYYFSTK